MLKKALYDIDHIDDLNREINEKAQEGYELTWIGLFLHFQKQTDAEMYRYRAEPCGLFNTELPKEYKEAGWETVKGRFRGITVFKTNHPDAQPVLYGGKRAEAVWVEKVKSRLLSMAVAILLLYMAIMPLQLGMHDGDYSYLFDSFALFETAVFSLNFIVCVISLIMTFMRRDAYMKKESFIQKNSSIKYINGILALLMIAAAVIPAYQSTMYLWRLTEYLFALFILVWMMDHETTMAFMIINFLLANNCLLLANRFHKDPDIHTLSPADYGETAYPDEEEIRYAQNILGTYYEVACPEKYAIESIETKGIIIQWIWNREMNRYNSKWLEINEEEWMADGAAYAPDYNLYLLRYGDKVFKLFDDNLGNMDQREAFGKAISLIKGMNSIFGQFCN